MKIKLNSHQLKIIAFVAMVIDHFAVIVLRKYFYVNTYYLNKTYDYFEYDICRMIGRISFPIFAFLLVEGMRYTSNRKKYMCRIFLFATISEIPFDLGVSGKYVNIYCQNVLFTFFIGLSIIYLFIKLDEIGNKFINIPIKMMCVLCGMYFAKLINVDYGFIGVLAIVLIYLQKNKIVSICIACLLLIFFMNKEFFSIVSMFPIILYDGTRGNYNKYFFYFAYPIHLLLFRMITFLL